MPDFSHLFNTSNTVGNKATKQYLESFHVRTAGSDRPVAYKCLLAILVRNESCIFSRN